VARPFWGGKRIVWIKRMFIIQAVNSVFENANLLNLINALNPRSHKKPEQIMLRLFNMLAFKPLEGFGVV
jgi:hypothetical protein